ncbi:unnamed protein product [Cuscuta epithymum]|uniref:Uncharacterized protein n=1 Tax=Cuscuta epithymum TaxID=186058 RepID=A0AAV0D0W9_9ASTE|nr:unnamed protein product [Cuscuta epithymum]
MISTSMFAPLIHPSSHCTHPPAHFDEVIWNSLMKSECRRRKKNKKKRGRGRGRGIPDFAGGTVEVAAAGMEQTAEIFVVGIGRFPSSCVHGN